MTHHVSVLTQRLTPPAPHAAWQRAEPGDDGGATPVTPTTPTTAPLIHLLVIDDDPGTCDYLSQLLRGFAQVAFATNTDDALRLAAQQPPDLVLVDVEPDHGQDHNGFDACRRLRAQAGARRLPIVFTTRHGSPATEAAALQQGADDFIRKPFDDVQVLARLRTQLRSSRARPRATGTAGAASPTRILIVDDDPISIQLVRRQLAEVGECHFALNGAQALELAAELRPDLILLDIDLPDHDGFHLCKQLRADPALGQVPIVFLTQSATLGHEARALALGGDDFMRKPFEARVLRARVRRLVDVRRAQPRLPRRPAASASSASMLSCIAHELGNPLNVIKGFAELMQADALAPLPAAQAEKLRHILDATARLSHLLADVTDVARMESGRFTVALADVALDALVHQACDQARAQATQAGMALHAGAVPLRVRADPRRLRQCLDNLLTNAIKYGRDGRRIDVQVEPHGAEVVLAVQDEGPGLTDGQMAQLFEPYNRLGHDGGAIPGTGLGLLLTRELAQAMGGRLVVHGRPGRGARFELWLPASISE